MMIEFILVAFFIFCCIVLVESVLAYSTSRSRCGWYSSGMCKCVHVCTLNFNKFPCE